MSWHPVVLVARAVASVHARREHERHRLHHARRRHHGPAGVGGTIGCRSDDRKNVDRDKVDPKTSAPTVDPDNVDPENDVA